MRDGSAPTPVEVVESGSAGLRAEVLALCQLAYREDLTELLDTVGPATHVLVREGDALVSHAMWCTRWLQVGGGPLLKTAYVEAVATHPDFRKRGFASHVMRRLVSELPSVFELAALCPANRARAFYEGLGWRFWLGPLEIRLATGELLPTPDESVMVYELEGRTPPDRMQRLSAEWRPGEVW